MSLGRGALPEGWEQGEGGKGGREGVEVETTEAGHSGRLGGHGTTESGASRQTNPVDQIYLLHNKRPESNNLAYEGCVRGLACRIRNMPRTKIVSVTTPSNHDLLRMQI
jgi:hypothetical protein